jgi:Spy/CpxP family protein refolding chaperone
MLFIMMALMLTLGTVSAQQPNGQNQDGRQRIEQQIRHYTAVFALDEAQAQQFGALYKAYNKKMRAVHDLYHQPRPAEGTALTDEQVEKRILDNFAQSRAILDVREQYYAEFRKVLTPTQINTIFEDEKARRAQMRR